MSVEVMGTDHVFVAVRDLRVSEQFYDHVMDVLGFRKWEVPIGGDPHVVYYNRHFVYSLRPAREGSPDHDPYALGCATSASGWWMRRQWTVRPESSGARV